MEIKSIKSFFVHPSKNEKSPKKITSTDVPKANDVFGVLQTVFDKSDVECVINVLFKPDEKGKQNNAFKKLLVEYAKNQTDENGMRIAEALQSVTTKKSGLGLLFIVFGEEGAKTKIVLSRFAADQGISASESKDKLNVQFVQNVFMKNAIAYKSAMFQGSAHLANITGGKAIDKQMSGHLDNIAHYWITHFLQCALETTAATGSNRLAVRIKDAISTVDDSDVKSEIIAAASLLKNVNAQPFSGKLFCEKYSLSEDATSAIAHAFKDDSLFRESFMFDASAFQKVLSYKSIEMSNGAFISANAYSFNDVFKITQLNGANSDEVQVTTSGKIVNEKLTKAAP